MSLTVNGNSAGEIAPIEEGTHLGVCSMLVDLGLQYSETYKNSARKVLIGWEIPGETVELDDGPHPRTLSKRYTASLNERASLRQDLAAWRGRDFTPEELTAFDLHRIVGTSCLINVIHRETNGRTCACISNIMALPKGMPKGKPSDTPIVYDIDADPPEAADRLPKWIAELVKKSETYQARITPPAAQLRELSDGECGDGELPF
jgi:hypothetical protein